MKKDYEAMSTRELFELSFPEPTHWILAWYAQRPASERFRMRMQPLHKLVDPAFRNCDPALPEQDIWKGIIAALELARRARAAGSKCTGRWVWEEMLRVDRAKGWTDLEKKMLSTGAAWTEPQS
jgi:hypothetical protein